MKIASLDLGQKQTAMCVLNTHDNSVSHGAVSTTRQALHEALTEVNPDRVVMEIGPSAGWICDLCRELNLAVQVANPNHEAWRWRNQRHKSDRSDALKLARLSAMDQLPTVHMPDVQRREHRALIRYRQKLVQRATMVKNSIRAILTRQGWRWPAGKSGWTQRCLRELEQMSLAGEEAWRLMLAEELEQLAQVERSLHRITQQLNEQGRREAGVRLLRTVPGVGPRLAETIVAVLDDPHRFKNRRQVASYAGLAPRRYQSGAMDRQGRISGQGDKLLRSMLVEVAWLGLRHNPWMHAVYEQALRGSCGRKKIAIVAVARRLLIRCWAMLRDGTPWREPAALCLAA